VELLSWDTDFFGIAIGRARITTARDLEVALTAASDQGVECLYLVVPGAKADPLIAAVRAGSSLTALRLDLEHRGPQVASDSGTVRPAAPEEAGRVAELAAALAPASRFAQDSRFSRERIAEMYRVWALNDLRNGKVLVDTTGERGLLTLSKRPSGLAVGLVYVAGAARGTGLGRQLLDAAAAEAAGTELTVVTDVRNLQAVRLYESAGFRARSLEAVLHVWLDALD
jgi:ribosomal protein S18 acetylase RimI-like enzyme